MLMHCWRMDATVLVVVVDHDYDDDDGAVVGTSLMQM